MSVGLMLLPAITARFWTDDISALIPMAVLIAMVSSVAGLLLSYHLDLPSGPAIVLVNGLFYALSILVGARGGLLWRLLPARHLEA